jgi:hypothetical protein
MREHPRYQLLLDAKLQNIPHTSKQKVLASLACHYYKTQNQKEG